MFFAEYLSVGRNASDAAGPPGLYVAHFLQGQHKLFQDPYLLTEARFIAFKSPTIRISDTSPFWLPNPSSELVGDKIQL